MTLIELREQFAKLSGRYDLVDSSDWSDNGADWFIQSGQKWLDRFVETSKSVARVFKDVSAGDYAVTFQNARSIKEVWVANKLPSEEGRTDSTRTKLTKKDLSWIRENYNKPWRQLDTARPLYYAPALLRMEPHPGSLSIEDAEGIAGHMDVMFAIDQYDYNGVIFTPPCDENYMVEIIGYFYTPKLVEDDDENYWSSQHPNILLMAAFRQVEVFYRNTEGVNDWTNAITGELTTIEQDVVEEDITDIDQMEG